MQYDATSFENGFQSNRNNSGTLLGNFRRASIDSIGKFRVNSNMPVEQMCFRKWKKILLYLFTAILIWRLTWCTLFRTFLSLGSEVSTAESHLVKNCTYISGSHHDVYLVQLSNYRSIRVIVLMTNHRALGNISNLNHDWSSYCGILEEFPSQNNPHPLDVLNLLFQVESSSPFSNRGRAVHFTDERTLIHP